VRPPLRLDIGWHDLTLAAGWGLWASDHLARLVRLEASWGERAFACLSVRSGLDSYLTALELPQGSEVLVSGYTIPDMVRVLEHHGLVAVPVDLDLETLAPPVQELRAARTERTRAVLVAHLFGSQIDLGPIAAFAREHGLLLLEDGAQVFGTANYRGHPDSDLALFSFGTIKTATALGGAILDVRDPEQLAAMKLSRDRQPLWPRAAFLKKVARACAMKLLSYELTYGACVRLCRALGWSHEDRLHRSVRGFHGDLIESIRHAPNAPLLALLQHRLRTYPEYHIPRRTEVAREALEHLPPGVRALGTGAPQHTHWVLAVLCEEPDRLIEHLRAHGLDATRAATVTALEREGQVPRNCARLRDELVYIPAGPEFSALAQARLERALDSFTPVEAREPALGPAT
jgi:dTDP-4-amino-4,6-dideoxygalactose transaminase